MATVSPSVASYPQVHFKWCGAGTLALACGAIGHEKPGAESRDSPPAKVVKLLVSDELLSIAQKSGKYYCRHVLCDSAPLGFEVHDCRCQEHDSKRGEVDRAADSGRCSSVDTRPCCVKATQRRARSSYSPSFRSATFHDSTPALADIVPGAGNRKSLLKRNTESDWR